MNSESLTGWGRTAPTMATIVAPGPDQRLDEMTTAPSVRGLIARGLGRSYGDAAQNGGGTVAVMTALDRLGHLDAASGRLRVQAGASLDQLMRTVIPLGWFMPVSPGTRQVTIGGAVAADIHGKNHHRDGSFCLYVDEIDLHAPSGRVTLRPDRDPEAFWATAGGVPRQHT